ncbi:MAG TPA: STAS domain-containing protein [Sumerlaeia bacterium]|nr:STAS domain-containing protein [Sumerlaeia bacterium]
MELEIMEHGDHLLVSPSGDIVWDSCNQLREAIARRIDADEDGDAKHEDEAEAAPPRGVYTRLWLDLGDVTLIDSVGLGVLMGIRMMCHRCNVRLTLVEPSKQVMATLKAVKFDSLFDIVGRETAETAVLENSEE